MIASANPNRQCASSQSQSASPQYLSIGAASRLLSISREALRAYEKNGRLVSYRTAGNHHGHRRYLKSDLLAQCLGVEATETAVDGGKRIAVYCRCSAANQKDSLNRQLNRMLTVVAEREGVDQSALIVFQEIASSFGERPKLNSLIDAICSQQVKRIYVEHQDRLSRVPALTRMVEHLCKKNDVELICLDREETQPDEMANAMSELVEFCQVICNRMSSRKQAERKREVLPPECLDFVRVELAKGRSIRDVCARATEAGFKTEKGQPPSYRVIRRYLQRIVKKLPAVEGIAHTFSEFVSAHLKKKKGSRVQISAVHSAFAGYCMKKGIVPTSARMSGDWLKANGYTTAVSCGYSWLENVEILGYSSVLDGKGVWMKEHDNGIRTPAYKYGGRKTKHQRGPTAPR